METKIQNDLRPLYKCYSQYKLLFDYYKENKSIRSRREIEERLDYLKKNKCKERSEIETLLWFLKVDNS